MSQAELNALALRNGGLVGKDGRDGHDGRDGVGLDAVLAAIEALGRRIDALAAPPVAVVAEPAPEVAAPISFEQLATTGVMLVEDELTIRRGLAWARVSDHAEALIDALVDANRRVEMVVQIAHIANKRQLGLPLSASDIEAESGFVALQAREDEIRRFERHMRGAVRHASIDMLREFDVEGAGWPAPARSVIGGFDDR